MADSREGYSAALGCMNICASLPRTMRAHAAASHFWAASHNHEGLHREASQLPQASAPSAPLDPLSM